MRAAVIILAMVGCLVIGTGRASAASVRPDREGPAKQSRLADLAKGSLWCRITATHAVPVRPLRWDVSPAAMRPKWIVAPRWPQLFADGRYTSLNLDPIRRRPWWE